MNPNKQNGLSFLITKGTRIAFILFSFVILGFALNTIQVSKEQNILRNRGWLCLLLLAGCIIATVAVCLFLKSSLFTEDKKCKRWVGVCGVFILLMQLLFVYFMRIQLRYDSLEVFEEACNLLKTGQIALWDYFGANAHQRGTLYLTWGLLKIAQILHIPETAYVLYLNLWCIFFVDSSLCLTGYCIYQQKKWKGVSLFALICLFQPFTYIWCSFYYTTIQCLPFMAVLLVCVFVIPKCHKNWQICIIAVLLGLSGYLGNMIRPTVLIGLVALSCFAIANVKKDHLKSKTWWKKAVLIPVVFLIVYFGCQMAYNKLDDKMVTIDTESLERPMLFWVAMGAKGDGTWDGNDAAYLAEYATAEQKQEATLTLLGDRLKSLNLSSALTLVGKKIRVTWAEGNDDFISENASSLRYGWLYEHLIGDKNGFFLYYCQLQRVFLMLLVLLGTIFVFREKRFTPADFARLAVVGGILFHILWEAKRLYSLPFMPFLLFLFVDGTIMLWERCGKTDENIVHKNRILQIALLLSFVVTLLWLGTHYETLTIENKTQKSYVASQLMERCDIKHGLMEQESVRQDFYANRPFNTIGVQVRNYSWYYDKENESVYKMTLTDAEDQVIREAYIYGTDFEDYKFSDTGFETVIPPEGGSIYHFTIETVYADDISYLVFYKKAATAIDPYPWGDYVENGVRMEQTDLTFQVYLERKEPDVHRGVFWIGGSVFLFLQIFMIYLFRKQKEKPI